jgi:hypothetical protein
MGYESKIYIVKKHQPTILIRNDGKVWGDVIATVDLCKCYPLASELRYRKATECYIYEGDEEITEDKYGQPLTETPLDEFIDIMREVRSEVDGYRRFEVLYSLVKSIKFEFEDYDEIVILHYGY